MTKKRSCIVISFSVNSNVNVIILYINIFWFCSTIHLAQINKENTKHLSITSSSQIQFPHLASLLASSGLQAGMEKVWKVEKELKVEVDIPQSPPQ